MNSLRRQGTPSSVAGEAGAVCLLLAGAVRFVQAGFLPATRMLTGDFGAVFPTAYFARWRPDFSTDQVNAGWTYGPMVHFLTLPLFLVPRWSMVPAVWALTNLTAIVASFVFTCRLSGQPTQVPWPVLASLAGLWLLFQPLANCLAQGNIELIELAMILGALAALQRAQTRSGVLIGVATMLKLLPIGFLGWFLLKGQWRAFKAGIATLAAIAVVTTVTLGWSNSALSTQHYWASPSDVPQTNLHTLSLTSWFLHRASQPDYKDPNTSLRIRWFPSAYAQAASKAGELASAMLAVAFGVALFAGRRRRVSPFEVSILFMAMFLVVPWNHDYYYVFGLIPLSMLFLAAVAGRRRALLTVTIVAYLMMSPPIPFSWIDRTHWFAVSFAYVINYYDIPVIGALLLWLAATYEWLRDGRDPAVVATRPPAAMGVLKVAVPVMVAIGIGVFWVAGTRGAADASNGGLTLQPPALLSGPPAFAMSPDGRRIAYISEVNAARALCVRVLAPAATTCWPGADFSAPFFSPDGRSVGFLNAGVLKRVSAAGGGVENIRGSLGGASSASWGPDDTIVFATPGGIYRIAASGGVPELLVLGSPDSPYFAPTLLPEAETLLFTVVPSGGGFGEGTIVGQSLKTGRRRKLLAGSQPHYDAATGHLIYALGGRVRAVPFDPITMAVSGIAVPLTGYVRVTIDGGAQFAMSDSGSLIYEPGSSAPVVRRTLMWVDREGVETALPIAPNAFEAPRLSPDGRTLAVAIRDVITDVWTSDLAGTTMARLTRGANRNDTPVWTPDGRAVSFAVPTRPSIRTRVPGEPQEDRVWPFGVPGVNPPKPAVLMARVDGADRESTVLWEARTWDSREPVHLSAWSPDGRVLAGTQSGDLWLLDTTTVDAPTAGGPTGLAAARLTLVQAPFAGPEPVTNRDPAFSPDGRWIAYASDKSGRSEIYVQAYPGLNQLTQVSQHGGTEPVWARNGRELFYRQSDALMTVAVTTQPAFSAGSPRPLFRGRYLPGRGGRTNYDAVQGVMGARNYDVAPDGAHFLMIRAEGASTSSELRVLRGWTAMLAR